MNKLKILGLVAVLALTAALPAYAAEFFSPEGGKNSTITLPASDTHHNLYTAGGNVIINSRTTGDLYTAGGMVKVIGDVETDAVIAGGNIDISGKIGGDLRVAGGNISINNSVGSDLLAAGGNVYVSESSSVAGDFVAGGGNVELNAPVSGIARIGGSEITINSQINGEVWVTANKQLIFGPKAQVSGKINYYGNSDPIIRDGAKVGTIERHALPQRNFNHRLFARSLFGVGIVVSLIAWLLAALLFMYLFKPELLHATNMMHTEPWANFGIGFVTLIVTPILFVLLLLSIFGYVIAFFVFISYLFLLMLSCLVAAVFVGRWIYGYIDRNATGLTWHAVVIGVIAFKIITWIPVLGWIVGFVLSISAFGVILRMARRHLRKEV